jgi:hypothetical protein
VCHDLLRSIKNRDHICDLGDCYEDGAPKLEYDLSDRVVREYVVRVIERCFTVIRTIHPVSDSTVAAVYDALTTNGRLVEIDGSLSPDEVFATLTVAIDQARKNG